MFVTASLLLQRVLERRLPSLSANNLGKLFKTCFFISLKLVEEVRTVRLKEFAAIVDCLPMAIELLEVGILCKIIAFNLTFEQEAVHKERLRLEGEAGSPNFDSLDAEALGGNEVEELN